MLRTLSTVIPVVWLPAVLLSSIDGDVQDLKNGRGCFAAKLGESRYSGRALLAAQLCSATSSQAPAAPSEVLTADTPRATVEGNKFIAPAGWRIEVRGPATILEPPEGGSHIALVDVHSPDADTAVAAAWAAY